MDSTTSRSSLSALEADDTTMIALSQEIDQHTANLRNSVLQSVANIRYRINLQAAEAIEHHHTVTHATEQRLTLQVGNLQDILETRTAELERERQVSQKLQDFLYALRKREKDKDAAVMALRAWRDYASRQKRLEQAGKLLSQRKQEREARAAFHAWRLQSLKNKFETQMAKQASDHRKEMLKAVASHQASENASRIEILALKEKIAADEEQRGALEEKMKAAFMRGVCALNVEAMQVLRGGVAGSGNVQPNSDVGQVQPQQPSISHLLDNIVSTLSQSGETLSFPLHNDHNPSGTPPHAATGASAAGGGQDISKLVARQSELEAKISSAAAAQRPAVITLASTPIPSALPPPPLQHHQPFTVTVNPSYTRPTSSGIGTARTSSSSGQRLGLTNTVRPSTASGSRLLSGKRAL